MLILELFRQESLEIEARGDSLVGEQTWPSEEEMRQADGLLDEGRGRGRRSVPDQLPPGMSSYQADWYVDEEGNFDLADLASEEGDDFGPDGDDDDRTATRKLGPGSVSKEANEDAMFPDEMDTPQDEPARHRFARYRALQSFRASPWHPKENLPLEYSRIYAFENFGNTR